MRPCTGSRPIRTGTAKFSAAQVHVMLREAMVLVPPTFWRSNGSGGRASIEIGRRVVHVDVGMLYPRHTRPATKMALALADRATALLVIDQDVPL